MLSSLMPRSQLSGMVGEPRASRRPLQEARLVQTREQPALGPGLSLTPSHPPLTPPPPSLSNPNPQLSTELCSLCRNQLQTLVPGPGASVQPGADSAL